MRQRLLGCDAFAGVVDEDAVEEVEESTVEFGGGGDDFL